MRKLVPLFTVILICAGPAKAQEEDAPSMMERGAQQFLEGLLKEMEPAWRELQGFMDEMGPAMMDLMEEVKDWSAYDPPVILENGDIIIRRKPELPDPEVTPEPVPELEPVPQIEL